MVNSDAYATILAGGQGTRFWPVSRADRPKQFLSISKSGESLIQVTAKRIVPLVGADNVCIVTNVAHKEMIVKEVPYAAVYSEPVGRNTAASIGYAAVQLLRRDPRSIMVVLPADHAVQDEDNLRSTLQRAIETARASDSLVTIGIKPTYAHTGYGYIRRGESRGTKVFSVSRFFEKPNLARAQEYVQSGEYYWNSGMFVWRAEVFMRAVQELMPPLAAGLKKIASALGTSNEVDVIEDVFTSLESLSVDFGILEHTRECLVVEAEEYGWNDVGSWDAWADHFDPDAAGNVTFGEALMLDSKNCVVYSKHRFSAVLGVNDLIVIDSGDALLVCPRERAQEVKKIVEHLKEKGREELL